MNRLPHCPAPVYSTKCFFQIPGCRYGYFCCISWICVYMFLSCMGIDFMAFSRVTCHNIFTKKGAFHSCPVCYVDLKSEYGGFRFVISFTFKQHSNKRGRRLKVFTSLFWKRNKLTLIIVVSRLATRLSRLQTLQPVDSTFSDTPRSYNGLLINWYRCL